MKVETLTSAAGNSCTSPWTQEPGRVLVSCWALARMVGLTRVTVLPELRRAASGLPFTLTDIVGASGGQGFKAAGSFVGPVWWAWAHPGLFHSQGDCLDVSFLPGTPHPFVVTVA